MEEHLSAPSAERRVLDHAANEPESPRRTGTSYDYELERVTRARTYFDDHDPINRAIRRDPTRSMLIAAGVGFVFALLVR
ncbi:hypothetical protein GIW81_04220 [Hyphomicrobium sp. xq]|uniref:DUF883 domain-containing protein n=1 Tax=Hyphomicrobium album TaxID=2665159 RepID=A0A6I3KG64_9HYPH|nr:hypothetical protein [Hyphomicrobium album]MTD93538.1 hypothetical protein [Hyphomicrobium album]